MRVVRLASMLAAVAALSLPMAASAQRDPAYEAARQQGVIGEQPDGYLGFVGSPSAAVRALVEDLNIKRKAAYTAEARAQGATVEEVAFVGGCRAILRTQPGEKYRAPDGSWQTRSSGAPSRDPRCP